MLGYSVGHTKNVKRYPEVQAVCLLPFICWFIGASSLGQVLQSSVLDSAHTQRYSLQAGEF